MGTPGQGGGMEQLLILGMMAVVIFYFIVFRPEANKQKTLAGLDRGDRVLTKAGVYGTVMGVDGDVVLVRVADQLKVEVSLTAIEKLVSKSKDKD